MRGIFTEGNMPGITEPKK